MVISYIISEQEVPVKNILCAFAEPEPGILEELFVYGREHGWQLELCGRRLPPGWTGDGVLTDYLSSGELRGIRNFDRTPVVSRELHPENNVRTVAGDTGAIASMIAEYFIGKGFTRFAAVDAREWPGGSSGFLPDPVKALGIVLAGHGLSFDVCYWKPDLESDELADYGMVMRKLRAFFRRLPKPVALLVPNSRYLAVTYRVLASLRIKVPEEVAILCNTDNSFITENASVPTTRINGELHEVGRKMAELLDRMLRGEAVPPEPVYVAPAAIVPRRSTDVLAVPDVKLATAVSFLLSSYMNFISVADAARAAGISGSMLNRKFRQHLGRPPLRFLLELRMNRIRDLLDGTDLPLPEIAMQTGYGSGMALSLAFKRETGMTPGAYRLSRRMNRPDAGT